jgi:hypothetical protein
VTFRLIFQPEAEQQLRALERSPGQARRYKAVLKCLGLLETNLLYPEESLDGVLAWDMFDYLPEELLQPTSARLHALLKAGGLLLTLFRKRSDADTGNRYRLLTQHSFAVMPSALALRPQRALQNRAILNLFAAFSSSRTFIGRDNLREVLFVK